MKLQIIGTASAKEELNRFHSSFIISSPDGNILFDAGDGISQALLSAGVNFNSIESIVISHFHSDHIAGLPLLITQMKISRRRKPLKIFVPSALLKNMNQLLNLQYIFPEKTDFQISVLPFHYEKHFSPDNIIGILPRKNSHVTNKYKIPSENGIPFESAGFLIADKKTKLYYTGDVANSGELNLFEDKNPTHILTEAFHISIEEIISFYSQSPVSKIYVSHYASEIIPGFKLKVNKEELQEKIILLTDGETVEL